MLALPYRRQGLVAHLPRVLPVALIGVAIVSVVAPSPLAAATGRWTPTLGEMPSEAVHAVLVPGAAGEHSRVLWWAGGDNGRVWAWTPANDDCSGPPLTGITEELFFPGANIFCSGHTQLSGAEGGQLLTVGGASLPVDWGLSDARRYAVAPGSGTWTALTAPRWPRWYPSVTTLRDSRALACSGNKGEQIWCFGGRRDDQPPVNGSGDLLHRFGRVQDRGGMSSGGYWEDPLTPAAAGGPPPNRPLAREGHATAFLTDPFAQAFFGGRDGSGNLIDDGALVWLLRRGYGAALAADYTYQWEKLPIASTQNPTPRREHTVVATSSTELLVFGGLRNPGSGETPTNELWRLYKNVQQNEWHWQQLVLLGTPSARYGHAAVYDATGNRMLVFGGSEQLGQSPADSRVWALSLGSYTWSELTVASGAGSQQPLPRRDHTLVLDPTSPTAAGSLVVYGGHLSSGAPSDTLWTLDVGASPSPAWSRTIVSPSPGARAGHAAVYDDRVDGGRLFIYGGEPAAGGGPVDNYVYMIEPFGMIQWNQWEQVPFRLSQHTANLDAYQFMMARVPEIFTPDGGGGTWTPAPAAAWLQDYYPVQFLVPGTSLPGGGGRVVTVGQETQARYLDIPAADDLPGGWQTAGSGTSGDAGFRPITGVLYRPTRIMIAGGRQGASAVGTTKRLDTDNLAAGWTASGSMLPRSFHNLVALPTGQVLVVGGMNSTDDHIADPSLAQVCPQLWNPDNDTWSASGDLECDLVDEGNGPRKVVRNYHSTAILLPDGRVLSAGGASPNPDRRKARIFCPPYLFKPDGTAAQRPVIGEWPRTLAWGDTFTICTANPTLIQNVSLIRPAATTHAFDQNQRHVRLTILERRSDPAQLVVRAPASPDSAPPGNYLLFILGSQDGPDVPSLAQWVNIGCPACDANASAANNDLFIEIVSESSVYPMWTAQGDNGSVGSATRYDLRRSTQPITAGNFTSATRVGMPPPLCPGWLEFQQVGGLAPCTTYYFALKTADGASNWSAMSNVEQATTIGTGGCGGGGFSAQRALEEGGGGSTPAGAGAGGTLAPLASRAGIEPTSASGRDPGAAPMVVETQRDGDLWRITVRFATLADGMDPAATSVLVEQSRADGARAVLGRIQPGASETLLGLCSLRERGRVTISGVLALEQVMPRVRHRGRDYALVNARHSRLGLLGATFLAEGGSPEMLDGDVLELTYAAFANEMGAAPSWYLLARRQGTASPAPLAQFPTLEGLVPSRFALHPSEPNPAATGVTLRFDLPVEGPVRLEVFDLVGRRVATVADAVFPSGSHRAEWNLRDRGGAPVRPGVYVYRMTAGEFRAKGKMSVLR